MTSVLYDEPGPRTRRRVLIGSVIASVLFAAALAFVLVRLYQQDQLTEARWGPLLNPANSLFLAVWEGIGRALLRNLAAAALAMVFSLLIGTLLAVTRITSAWTYRWLVVGVMELLRGLPVVITIFFAARVLPELGVDLPRLYYLVIGLTAYNCVIIAEIVRAGIASLPRGQAEAASAIGLTRGQALRMILLPQAFRAMLPALISQLVVILKDTSLGFVILYPELLRFTNVAVQLPDLRNPIQFYLVVAALFILINWLLSKLAEWVERRLSRARPITALPAGGAVAPGTTAPMAGTATTGG